MIRLFYWGRKALLAVVAALGCMLSACSGTDMTDVDGNLDIISDAIADGDYEIARDLCNGVLAMVAGPDSVHVDEMQAGRLGILYMRLSEHYNEEENIADATQCIRYAFRRSDDSLKVFSAALPLEDVRHFVLLRRIGLSIDNPVDLTDSDMMHEE